MESPWFSHTILIDLVDLVDLIDTNSQPTRLESRAERGNRLGVDSELRLPSHPEAFVVGDVAAITDAKTQQVLPQPGSVALQSGEHAGETIARTVEGKETKPFKYKDKGTMATIGRGAAVVQMVKNRDVMRADRLKQVMQQLDPAFDERGAGYSRFSKFVTDDDVASYRARNPSRFADSAGIAEHLRAAARRRAFRLWLDVRCAAVVELAPGYEHPGDPRQPDNTHRH